MFKNLIKLIILILMISSAYLVYGYEYYDSIDKTIGEYDVEFVIPKDYDGLLSYYKLLIDMYCESENNNLSKDNIIERYGYIVSELEDKILELSGLIYSYENKVDNYIEIAEKRKFYMGGLFDGRLSVLGTTAISLGPEFLTSKGQWYIGLGFPIYLMWNNAVDFGVGVQFRVGHKLQF